MNNTWAVMCGMIRVELCLMLAYLCGLRKNGEIDGIIFFAWEGGTHGYECMLKEINYKLYKRVLFSLIRHDSSKAIEEFKKLLSDGDMDDIEKQEADFIIEKFKI